MPNPICTVATALALIVLPLAAGAQNANSPQLNPAAPPMPEQHNVPRDAALNPALPTVFVVGDSTARNGANLGWGDNFAHFWNTSEVNVANRAIAGRSTRTYINEGHWAKVLSEMKPGDYVLFQLGHNDGGDLGGAKPRGSLKGIGNQTEDVPQTAGAMAGKTETVHTYGWYLREMIDQTKAKGAHPILLTLTIRNIWKPGPDGKPHIERDMGYNGFIRQVGEQEHIPVVDIAPCEASFFESIGQQATAAYFPKDHTHTSAAGAEHVASCVASSLRDAHLPVDKYLLPASQTADSK